MASKGSRQLRSFSLEDLEKPATSVRLCEEAVISRNLEQAWDPIRKNDFLLFAAIFIKAWEGDSAEDVNFGIKVKRLLMDAYKRDENELVKILGEVKDSISAVKNQYSSEILEHRREKTAKKARKHGASFMSGIDKTAEPQSLRKCSCVGFAEAQSYLKEMWNICNAKGAKASPLKNVLEFETKKVWKYYSFFHACQEKVQEYGKSPAKYSNADEAISNCLAACISLQEKVESNAKQPMKKKAGKAAQVSVSVDNEEKRQKEAASSAKPSEKDSNPPDAADKLEAAKIKSPDSNYQEKLEEEIRFVKKQLEQETTKTATLIEIETVKSLQKIHESSEAELEKQKEEKESLRRELAHSKEQLQKLEALEKHQAPGLLDENRTKKSQRETAVGSSAKKTKPKKKAAAKLKPLKAKLSHPDDTERLEKDIRLVKDQLEIADSEKFTELMKSWDAEHKAELEELRKENENLKRKLSHSKELMPSCAQKEIEIQAVSENSSAVPVNSGLQATESAHFLPDQKDQESSEEMQRKNQSKDTPEAPIPPKTSSVSASELQGEDSLSHVNKESLSPDLGTRNNHSGENQLTSNQSQETTLKAEAFFEVEEISDPRRPSEIARRFEDLFMHSYPISESSEEFRGDKYNERVCSLFVIDLLETVFVTGEQRIALILNELKEHFSLGDSISDNPSAQKALRKCALQICGIASCSKREQDIQWIKRKAVQSAERKCRADFRHNPLADALDIFVQKSVPVVWDILLQQRPLKTVNCHTKFDPLWHVRFYGSNKSCEEIKYFVWPCLTEQATNKVLVKGKVVTGKGN